MPYHGQCICYQAWDQASHSCKDVLLRLESSSISHDLIMNLW